MSERAKQLLWKKLKEEGALDFDETVNELVDEFDVKRSSAANYVYQYCEWESTDNGKVITDRAEKYRHQSTFDTAIDDEDGEMSAEVVDTTFDDPIPERTGEEWNGLEVVEEGHPLVPDAREYIARKLDNDTLPFELGDNVTDREIVARSISYDDWGTLLIGEPGTGKGHLVKHVFNKANRPLIRLNFGTRITKEKLVGGFVPRGEANGDLEHTLEKAREMSGEEDDLTTGEALSVLGERNKFKWSDGLLTKAVRYGWGFLADELNAAPAETLMPLFGLLEDSDSRTLELTEKGEVIRPHPEFKFIATMNPPHHAGTKRLNDALMRRLIPITIPYLPNDREQTLLEKRTGLDGDTAEDLVDMADAIRKSYPNDVNTTCTFSELEQIARMGQDVMEIKAAAKMVLLSAAETESDRDALKRRMDMLDD